MNWKFLFTVISWNASRIWTAKLESKFFIYFKFTLEIDSSITDQSSRGNE